MLGEPMTSFAEWWVDHPYSDYVVVIAVAAATVVLDVRDLDGTGDVGAFLQTFATVAGILLSLGTIAVTLVFTVTPTDRLERALEVVGPRLGDLLMRCLGALVVVTVSAAVLFTTEGRVSGQAQAGLVASASAFGLLRFGRLWWLLRKIIAALAIKTPPTGSAGEWERPRPGPDDYRIPRRTPDPD